ncbi:MAG: TatD family hydrolase [Candidatus Brocadiia bacterium]
MDAFDVHAHLNLAAFEDDLDAVLGRADEAGVSRILCVGVDLETSRRAVELAQRYPDRILAAVGIHPNHWADSADEMDAVAELAADLHVAAIGETGLDFYHEHTPRDAQVDGFRWHLSLARAVSKPIIVHARRSDDEVLRILSDEASPAGGVRHCFDRPWETAKSYFERGFHISLAAAVTRPGYKKLKAAVARMPGDRLLVETDCPYQSPASRSGERNEPAFITETIEAAAALRDQTPDEFAALTTANARALFLPDRRDG